jgi:hypothetical protein
VIFRINTDYFSKARQPVGLYSGNAERFLVREELNFKIILAIREFRTHPWVKKKQHFIYTAFYS